MTRPTGEDEMSSEHVEVLRVLRERAAEWGHETENLSALDAAIAALSAPQPPAEAQPVAWEWEYVGNDPYPRGQTVARALHEMDPQNPPYPETWRPTRPLVYGDAAPQQPAAVDDSALLDALARESWKLDPFDMPTPGGDDADVGWRVIEYHRDHPCEREVAVHYGDDPRAALRAALAAQPGGSDNDR